MAGWAVLGALDNEMWAEVTCASLAQLLLEPSCCSIISLFPLPGDLHAWNGGCSFHLGPEMKRLEQGLTDYL